jgi:hypothetical protein
LFPKGDKKEGRFGGFVEERKTICIFTFGILTHAKGERVWQKIKLSTHVKEEEVEEG